MATGPTTVPSLASSSRNTDAALVELRGPLYAPPPGQPGYLCHRLFGWLESKVGGQKLTMKAQNWQIAARTGRDGRRAIGQDNPPQADPADFRNWTTSFNGDEGFEVPIDRRQVEVDGMTGGVSPQAAMLAIDQSRDYLFPHLDVAMLGTSTTGINASTLTGEVGTATPGTAGSGPYNASVDPWSDPDADIEGQVTRCIKAYQLERYTRPNAMLLSGSAVLAAQQNYSFRPTSERIGGTPLFLDSMARLGITTVYVGIDNLGIALGTVVFFQEEDNDPRRGYRPFVASYAPIADYMMETVGANGMGVGVHTYTSAKGSIDYARVACMRDSFYDNLGLARLINVLS